MLRVMTFNVRLDLEGDRPNHWLARRPLLQQVLQQYPADLLAFQEVMPNQHQDLIKMLPDYSWHGRGREPQGDGEGCYVFWRDGRFRGVAQETFWLAPDPSQPGRAWDAGCPRICNHVLLRDQEEDREIEVYNVHLDHVGVVARQKSAEIVRQRIDQSRLPTLVLGDFNVERACQQLSALQGLQDCFEVHGSDQEGTFHGFNGWPTLGPIDYVLTSADFEVDFCQRITDRWEEIYPSDHFGLLAHLQWK
jgi:endonuclease/exonuclease/phosphatase family metal-dependent hydrolase